MKRLVVAVLAAAAFSLPAVAQQPASEVREPDRQGHVDCDRVHHRYGECRARCMRGVAKAGEPNPCATKAGAPNPYATRAGDPNPFATRAGDPNPFATRAGEPNPFATRAGDPNPYATPAGAPKR